MPKDAKSGDTIHIIAEVKDQAKKSLKNIKELLLL
ncbi:hypothetical protein [Ignavigranum ruoffiae]